jgi:fructosamine-3-kinase
METQALTFMLTKVLGGRVRELTGLSGGSISQVFQVQMTDGRVAVAKWAQDNPGAMLTIEANMLRYLRTNTVLPIPEVLHATPDLLIMSHIEGSSFLSAAAQTHAAELIAGLHTIRGQSFGFQYTTLIGGLPQPNPQTAYWIPFFREHRLLYMAREAHHAGKLPQWLRTRIEKMAGSLERWLTEPEYPALIHGDLWTTNILAQGKVITGFIDPAIYFAHPEIELAFSTLFDTFDESFFDRYNEIRPIQPGFFEERRDIYNLYPLLVHVRLFGGGYVNALDRIVTRFGF